MEKSVASTHRTPNKDKETELDRVTAGGKVALPEKQKGEEAQKHTDEGLGGAGKTWKEMKREVTYQGTM